jgi:hypothetical protein
MQAIAHAFPEVSLECLDIEGSAYDNATQQDNAEETEVNTP